MKKTLAMLLALVMLLSLCACSNNDSQTTDPSNSSQATTEGTEKPTDGTEGTTGTTQAPTDEPTTAPTDESTTPPTQAPTEAPTTPPTTCSHSWKDATCTAPKTCSKCGATEGSAAGHSWKDATCTTPKTCSKCGVTNGNALGHSWNNATCTTPKACTVCNQTEGTSQGHTWKDATCTAPKTCSDCGETRGEEQKHNWNEKYVCTHCQQKNCDIIGHGFLENRCFKCGAYDEESTNLAKKVLSNIIKEGMTEYEKVKAIHDYIVFNTYYNGVATNGYSPLGVLIDGQAVCQGYALAFDILCKNTGIDCVVVHGTTGRVPHAWNQVNVDNKWYNIDVTWDDPGVGPGYGTIVTISGHERYDYFLISDDQMYTDHTEENAQYICSESYQ